MKSALKNLSLKQKVDMPNSQFNSFLLSLSLEASVMLEFIRFLRLHSLADSQTLVRAEVSLENMRINLKSRQSTHRARFQDKDAKILLTQEDFSLFYQSTKAKEAILALVAAKFLKIREIKNVRNFLMTCILLENSCRPAALFDLQISTLEKAFASPVTDAKGNTQYVFPSFHDKTVALTGRPTYIVLSPLLKKRLEAYLTKFRFSKERWNKQPIGDAFLKENGSKMDTETISMGYRSVLLSLGKLDLSQLILLTHLGLFGERQVRISNTSRWMQTHII